MKRLLLAAAIAVGLALTAGPAPARAAHGVNAYVAEVHQICAARPDFEPECSRSVATPAAVRNSIRESCATSPDLAAGIAADFALAARRAGLCGHAP